MSHGSENPFDIMRRAIENPNGPEARAAEARLRELAEEDAARRHVAKKPKTSKTPVAKKTSLPPAEDWLRKWEAEKDEENEKRGPIVGPDITG